MEDQYNSDDTTRFTVSLSVDRDHFFRCTCPSCGRDFKTENNEADFASIINPQIQRMGLEIGATPTSLTEEVPSQYLSCPYCEYQAETSEMLTEDTVHYLHRLLMREIVLPMTHKMFSGLGDSLGGSRRHSGDFMSISFKHSRSLLPPRPIHGPEPPDMKIVEFLCCGKSIKVAERWNDLNLCTYCGTPIALV